MTEDDTSESLRLFKDTSCDETSNEDWLSKSLTELIKNSPNHYRLGVTRPLGTGKSTLIKKVIENLEKEDPQKEKSFKAINIDVWNLDKDSARRSTIYRLCKSLSFTKLKPEDSEKKKYSNEKEFKAYIEESLYGSQTELSEAKPRKYQIRFIEQDWLRLLRSFIEFVVLMFLSFACWNLFTIAGWNLFNGDIKDNVAILIFILSSIFLGISHFLSPIFINNERTFNRNASLGSEEFKDLLELILRNADQDFILIIFDNIDRALAETTREILAGITAFFIDFTDINEKLKSKRIITLVPFDLNCTNLTQQQPIIQIEINKYFDAVFNLPALIPQDLFEFTREKLKYALHTISEDEETLIKITELINYAYQTPREIKQFINHLSIRLFLTKELEKDNFIEEEDVSKSIVNLTKVLLMESLCPRITESSLSQGYNLAEHFHPSINIIGENTNKRLSDFLEKTQNITKISSTDKTDLDQYHYLNLPKQLRGIPNAVFIITYLENYNIDKLEELKLENRLNDLDIVADYVLGIAIERKAKPNIANIINSIITFSSKIEIKDFKKSFEKFNTRAVKTEVFNNYYMTPASIINKILPYHNDEYKILWKTMSNYYKDLLKSDGVSDENFKRAKDFIITVLKIESYDLNEIKEIDAKYFIDKEIQDAVMTSQNSNIDFFLNIENFVKFLDYVKFLDKSGSYLQDRNLQDTQNAQIKEQLKRNRSEFWKRFCESINKKKYQPSYDNLLGRIIMILSEKFRELYDQKDPSITDDNFNYLLFIYFLLNLIEFNDSNNKQSQIKRGNQFFGFNFDQDKINDEAFMQEIKSCPKIKSMFLIPRLILKKRNVELDQNSRIFFEQKQYQFPTEEPIGYSLNESFTLDMLENFKLVFGHDLEFLNDLKNLDSQIFTKLKNELEKNKSRTDSESELENWLSIQEKDKDSAL